MGQTFAKYVILLVKIVLETPQALVLVAIHLLIEFLRETHVHALIKNSMKPVYPHADCVIIAA